MSEESWAKLQKKLAQDYHSSVLLIREKMKVVLGFTVRRHREWIYVDPNPMSKSYSFSGKNLKTTICLDFYNEPKRTMFLLKYSEYLEKIGNTES